MTFVLFYLINFVQKAIIIPEESILFIRNGLTPLVIFCLCVGISLFVMINYWKLNEFYYYSRLILMIIGIVICMFDFSYFTTEDYIKSRFGFKNSTPLTESENVWIYATQSKSADYFHYEITFHNGEVVRLSDNLQTYKSSELLELDKIVRNYANLYKFEDFSNEEIRAMSKYELEIINENKLD